MDQDFIQEFNRLSTSQTQLHEVMMQNEGMQRKIIKLEAKIKRKKNFGDGGNNESGNSQDHISGSYDGEQDRSFNDNSAM